MAGDPLEVMGSVISQEASRLQALTDEELLLDARDIADAERQRARICDRLEAARGFALRCHLAGVVLTGVVSEVGREVILLESDEAVMAVTPVAVLRFSGLPHALRRERDDAPRVGLTWSAVLREWSEAGAVRFAMADGEILSAVIESVGADHIDVRLPDGESTSLMLTGVRFAVRSR